MSWFQGISGFPAWAGVATLEPTEVTWNLGRQIVEILEG